MQGKEERLLSIILKNRNVEDWRAAAETEAEKDQRDLPVGKNLLGCCSVYQQAHLLRNICEGVQNGNLYVSKS